MHTQAIETLITTVDAIQARRELTFGDVAKILRRDPETGHVFWTAAQRGRVKAGTRAGCELRRNGKAIGRVISIKGRRYREWHVAYLLKHECWPTEKRMSKPSAPRPASTATVATVPPPAPPIVPRDLPEVSRAVIAAAKPAHRGFLTGLARHFTR